MPSPDRTAGGEPDGWKAGGGLCLVMSLGMIAAFVGAVLALVNSL